MKWAHRAPILHVFPRPPPLPLSFFYPFFIALKTLFLPERPFCFPTSFLQLCSPPFFHCLIFVVKHGVLLLLFLGRGAGEGSGYSDVLCLVLPQCGSRKMARSVISPAIQHRTRSVLMSHELSSSLYAVGAAKPLADIDVWGTVPMVNHRCVSEVQL